MAVDTQSTNKEKSVRAGETITIQGHKYNSLNILHSGRLEMLYSDKGTKGKTEQDVLSSSLKIYTIEGEFSFNEYSLIHGLSVFKTVRAITDSTISVYPFTKDRLLALPATNPNLSLYVLRSILRKINIAIETINQLNTSYKAFSVLSDNVKIILSRILDESEASEIRSMNPDLMKEIQDLGNLYKQNGGSSPDPRDISFLTTEHGQHLSKDYNDDLVNVKESVDYDLLLFFYNFFKIDNNVLSFNVKNIPGLFPFPLDNLSLILNSLIQSIYEYKSKALETLEHTFGQEKSILSFLNSCNRNRVAASLLANNDASKTLIRGLLDGREKIQKQALLTERPDLISKTEIFLSQSSQLHEQISASAPARTSASGEADSGARSKLVELQGTFKQIMEYVDIDEEFSKQVHQFYKLFKELPDKLETSPEARRARNRLGKAYWVIYQHALKKKMKTGQAPLAVNLMLQFGLFDETLVSEQKLINLISFNDEYRGSLDIHTAEDWLQLIYKEEKIPSITEMGLNFDKFLLEEAKNRTYKEMEELKNDPDRLRDFKLQFEVSQMIASCSRICSETMSTAFPILLEESVTQSMDRALIYRQQIDETLTDIRKIDFTLFNREVILKTKFRVELIDQEVLPDIIIMPSVGSKIMMWQDLETSNKRTKARFAIPRIYVGDLRKNLILALARFRWELCRTMKGPQWADPIEGGITGYYFDYINFYKKNPHLSMEAKEKITEHVRNFRSNRERFAHDYLTWIQYESKGIAKLNKVLRDIFYRGMPFSKPYREKLKRMPLYEEIDNKYNNITNRKFKDLEIKFRKYEKDADGLPAELSAYLEMLKN